MRNPRQTSSLQSAGNSILVESIKYGPIVTFLVMALISGGAAYLIYGFLLSDWSEANKQHRKQVTDKEIQNKTTEKMVAGEPQFLAEFKKVAGSFDPGLCDGPTFDSIANQLAAASDIMLTGTQDPTQECNAISIGLGFEGDLVVLGSVAPPAPPPFDPCN